MSRLVFGIHPVEELLRRRPRAVCALFVAENRQRGKGKSPLSALSQLAGRHGIAISRSSDDELAALCDGGNHQGVVAMVGEHPYLDLETLLERLPPAPLLLAADSLQDPQNLGAMIRSAVVLGAHGLLLPKDRSVAITPAVVRVSAGASEHLPCARVTNLARSLERLRDVGFWVAGTVERDGVHPLEADLTGPTVVVVGNEHKGMRPLVQKKCDTLLTIPSAAGIASLNVAAATAVVLYEAARQRGAGAFRQGA